MKIKNTYSTIRIFIQQYIVELVLLLIGIILIGFIKTLPYINLFLIRPGVEFFLVFLLLMFIFYPRVKHILFFIVISVFFLLVFFSFLQSKFLIEQMGDILYAFLVIGYIEFLISLKKNK